MQCSYMVCLIFFTEFLPRLFLDEDYKNICDLLILDPTWLMTAMRVVVELGSKTAAESISNCQVLKFKRDCIADFDVFTACWKDSLPKGSTITLHQLCLIFQAYCLIFPVQCESMHSAGQAESRKFIIPCKLPFTIKDDYVYKLSESFVTFYFDFNDFLPDEVYHRLICLAWKDSENEQGKLINRLSKRSSFFVNLKNTNWLIEHEHQRLKIMFG